MEGAFRFLLVGIIMIIVVSAAEENEKIAKLFQDNSICMKESEVLEQCIKLNSKTEGKIKFLYEDLF